MHHGKKEVDNIRINSAPPELSLEIKLFLLLISWLGCWYCSPDVILPPRPSFLATYIFYLPTKLFETYRKYQDKCAIPKSRAPQPLSRKTNFSCSNRTMYLSFCSRSSRSFVSHPLNTSSGFKTPNYDAQLLRKSRQNPVWFKEWFQPY
jgi:hypothetical protein